MKKPTGCLGCEDEPYWHGLGGQNECWSGKSSKEVERLEIGVDQPPPYDKTQLKTVLSCYRRKRICYVKPESINDKGYWR